MCSDTSSEESVRSAWADAPGIEEHWKTSAGKGVIGRARVSDLLKHDKELALRTARAIEHPWYRCQAISSIAEASPSHPEFASLLEEALAAAYSQAEPNRVASVSRWPLRQLAEANVSATTKHAVKLLSLISKEPHGLRRLDGICSILVSVASIKDLREMVLAAFLESTKVSSGWRTERVVDTAIHVIAAFDREAAQSLLASRPVTRYTKSSRALLLPDDGAAGADA